MEFQNYLKSVIRQIRHFFTGLPENLRRVTSGSGFIPEIDGLRFLAILPVVIQHFSERILRSFPTQTNAETIVVEIFDHGHIGVYIFFGISGFILALPFGKERIAPLAPPVSIKKYYMRRLTRLEPPYLIAITFLFMILVVVRHQDFFALIPHYFASIFYVHRVFYGTWTPINPPAWTLEIEVMFYLFAPLLARGYFSITDKWKRRGLMVSLLIIKIIVLNTTTLFDGLYQTIFYLIEFFCVGILVADVYLTEQLNLNKTRPRYDWIALISLAVLFTTWTWSKNLSYKFVFLAALFLVLYTCFRGDRANRIFRNKWLTAIGGMCYSIYLLHLALAEFFVLLWKKITIFDSYTLNFFTGIFFFLPFAFLISTAFYLLIEKPCMDPQWPEKLKNRFLKRKVNIPSQIK